MALSRAESKVYRALQDIPGLHLVENYNYVSRSQTQVVDGEVDIIAISVDGLFLIEVKGGQVSLSNGAWTSTDYHGKTHTIKNPYGQLRKAKYALIAYLKRRLGYAPFIEERVALPDTVFPSQHLPADAPVGTLLDAEGIKDSKAVTDWLSSSRVARRQLSDRVREQIANALLPTVATKRSYYADVEQVSSSLDQLTDETIALTNEQISVLEMLSGSRRNFIGGRAGTGKTLVAIEQARRLRDSGMKVLFLTSSTESARWTSWQVEHSIPKRQTKWDLGQRLHNFRSNTAGGVLVVTATELAYALKGLALEMPWQDVDPLFSRGDRAGTVSRRGEVLSTKLETVIFGQEELPRFDAIVVDEGQDLASSTYELLELLLTDESISPLYVFADLYQRSLSEAGYRFNLPFEANRLVLNVNCRNTQEISRVLASLNVPGASSRDIAGPPVNCLTRPTPEQRADLAVATVERLIESSQFRLDDIRVVYLKGESATYKALKSRFGRSRRIDGLPVPCTTDMIKGLEAEVCIVVAGKSKSADSPIDAELYKAISRARSLLYIIAPQETLDLLRCTDPRSQVDDLSP